MILALVPVAGGAVLFAVCCRGLLWLYRNATWWCRPPDRPQIALEARYLPAVRSSRPAAGVQPAPALPVLEGKVVERGRIER